MAILNQDEDEQAQAGGATTGGGAGGFIGGGSGQGATTSVAPKPTSSGAFTNLQNYVTANEGQGDRMGQAARGVVDTQGQNTVKAIGDYTAQGTADAAKGTAKVDQGFLDQVKKATPTIDQGVLAKAGQGAMPGKVAYGGPTAAPKAEYTGQTDPTNFASYGNAAGQWQGLSQLLGLTGGDQAGAATLLGKAYQQPGYSAGENQLDAALTTGSTGGQQAITGAKDAWGNQGKGLDSAANSVGAQQIAGKTKSDQVGKQYTDAIRGGQNAADNVNNAYAAAFKPSFDTGTVGGGKLTSTGADATYAVSAPKAGAAGVSGVKSGSGSGGQTIADKAKAAASPGAVQKSSAKSASTPIFTPPKSAPPPPPVAPTFVLDKLPGANTGIYGGGADNPDNYPGLGGLIGGAGQVAKQSNPKKWKL